MLRYKTQTRPGLVALYDIRPGNGADLSILTTPEPAWDSRDIEYPVSKNLVHICFFLRQLQQM